MKICKKRSFAGAQDDRGEVESIKHGKKPTVEQKKLIKQRKLNPEDWLVERDTPEQMVIIHRFGNSQRIIQKGRVT